MSPTVKFDVPGFLDVGLWYYRERNHCGIAPCLEPGAHSEVTFDPTYLLNVTWGIPFHAGTLPLKFQGFVNFVGPKGKDYTSRDTAKETLLRTSLMLDRSVRRNCRLNGTSEATAKDLELPAS